MKTTAADHALTEQEQALIQELMERYDTKIRKFALSYLGSHLRDALPDVIQDAYYALCRQIDDLKTVNNPEAYIICIVARRIRWIRGHEERYTPLGENIPDPKKPDTGLSELLPSSISEADRDILKRRYERLDSIKEIAEDLDLDDAAVRQRLKRARDRSKDQLDPEGQEQP